MNRLVFLLWSLPYLTGCTQGDIVELFSDDLYYISGNSIVRSDIDSSSLLRNPCMGWVLYDDAWLETEDAEQYWAEQDQNARMYGSIFYIRWRWSDMEPTEGDYAWNNNPNFIKHIEEAKKRGLKIAFRIYNNSRDNLYQSTPDFVRRAGAEGYTVPGLYEDFWTPYPDDPIFQQKMVNFINAFAEKFDDPDIVDFIDGVNLGFWGECNNVRLKDQTKMTEVYKWITTVYGNAFKRVILVSNIASDFGYNNEKEIAVQHNGYALRRDGLGSFWIRDIDKFASLDAFRNHTLLLGEGAYWKGNDDNPIYKPWVNSNDSRIPKDATWRTFYEFSLEDALQLGYNTLDLREVVETTGWTKYGNDLVCKFICEGGYRFQPLYFSVPEKIDISKTFAIGHTWKNVGKGIFPNDNLRWNYKYKVAFALIDENDTVVCTLVDDQAEPSLWSENVVVKNVFITMLPDTLDKKQYTLSYAIIDKTKHNTPSIAVAVKGYCTPQWIPINKVTIY